MERLQSVLLVAKIDERKTGRSQRLVMKELSACLRSGVLSERHAVLNAGLAKRQWSMRPFGKLWRKQIKKHGYRGCPRYRRQVACDSDFTGHHGPAVESLWPLEGQNAQACQLRTHGDSALAAGMAALRMRAQPPSLPIMRVLLNEFRKIQLAIVPVKTK